MLDKVLAHIDAGKDANVERLNDWLRIPCISTDPDRKPEMKQAVDWARKLLSDCGIECQIIDTPGHPCLIGDTGSAEGPTVLVYGHYDVQPEGDESLWHSPPFEPTVRDGAIFARGAADDKGQALCHLLAAESWMKTAGKLPIRVKFLIEGEEEIGSPNLEKVLRDHAERLACDYVALSDTPKFNADTPAITYGTKGMIYKEIVLTGAKQNLHSGSYGGTLTNPGNAMAAIIASLRDADNRVTIPGFYDDVRAISDQERRQMDALPFDEEAYRKFMDVPSLEGEKGFTTLQRRWARPTLDVCGLSGGFTGEGASTVIPARMMGKVSMRIVPDQDPARISEAFDKAVHAATPAGVRVEIKTHALASPYLSDLGSPGMTAASEAIEAAFGVAPVYIREGGSLPILPLFKEILGADSLMMGFCLPDCNAHGPDEFLHVSDFHNGTKAAAHFMQKMVR